MKVEYFNYPSRVLNRKVDSFGPDRPRAFLAVVIDDKGRRWAWTEPLLKGAGTYQGSMGMLGRAYESSTITIEGWGTVPTSNPRFFGDHEHKHILQRYEKHPEEFVPYQSASKFVG